MKMHVEGKLKLTICKMIFREKGGFFAEEEEKYVYFVSVCHAAGNMGEERRWFSKDLVGATAG